jgi:Dynein heavy chain AAA lid domain/Dynein heavy chain region D6 P-loop domain
MIEDGMKQGTWVFLANCHLMLSWMSTLEKMIEAIMEGSPNPNFRLWLSSSPNREFPISILQRGIKMTTEPPKGLRSNMLTLYNTIGDEQFNRCAHESTYKKLLFSLVWFHAILLERRKFKSLGFNVSYDFNESDFAICHDLIIVFLDEYPDRIPFDAMKYLIAEANYGGRVTDDWDRRLVNVYIAELFCEDCVQAEKFMLSDLTDYYVPEDGDLKFYKEVQCCNACRISMLFLFDDFWLSFRVSDCPLILSSSLPPFYPFPTYPSLPFNRLFGQCPLQTTPSHSDSTATLTWQLQWMMQISSSMSSSHCSHALSKQLTKMLWIL